MRLSNTFALVLVGAFVLPTVGMGIFGRDALRTTEDRAGDAAAGVATRAERARLAQLTGRSAERADAELLQLQRRVEDLKAAFEAAEPTPITGAQRGHLHDYPPEQTAGLPGYGRFDPALGAYADFEHRGEAAVWVPRFALGRLEEPGRRARFLADLHRAAAVAPMLARFGRLGDTLDLAWIVTQNGVGKVWPPYDFKKSIQDNPAIVDLDETTLDYVTLASPAQDPDGSPRWVTPYLDRFKGVWLTSVVSPLYLDGEFAGTAGADLRLSAICERIRTLDLGIAGFPVLVGPEGVLIATTDAGVDALAWSPEYRAALLDAVTPTPAGEFSASRESTLHETPLTAAPVPGVAAIARAALDPSAGTEVVDLGGRRMLVEHAPIPTSGWGFAIVVPEADILASADEVRTVVEEGSQAVRMEYTLFGGLLFTFGLMAALVLHRITLRPLTDLSRRVEALTFDHLVLEPSPRRSNDEFAHLEGKVQELLGLITSARDGERAEHERLGAVLASMADAVVATDAEGRVRLLNPRAEALLGVTQAEANGRPLASILVLHNEADGSPCPDPTPQVLAASAAVELAGRLVARVPGGECAVEVRGAPLRAGDDAATGVVLVIRDVTQARRIEEELVRVQKLETVQVLAAGIAHDFNNLLAGVLGYVSLARALVPGDSPAQDRLGRAEAAVERARSLTLQLLTFSRGGEPVRSVADLRPVIAEASELAVRGAASQCELDLGADLWAVEADQGQIGQVVQNLVLNAAQAMPEGGRVQVRARNVTDPAGLPEGPYVEVSVEDHGVGIPKEQQKRIFDPFFTTKPRGTGLGLAVCHSILARHGGRIEVESQVGVGTRFRFLLPAAGRPARGVSADAPPEITGLRVLFLDDDADLRDVTAAMLSRLGCAGTGVADGTEAVERYRESLTAGPRFDAVVLDLTIPGGVGGVETLRRLRVLDPAVRAIVCSGYGSDPVLADPAAYGFAAALHKPYTLARLAAVIGGTR